MIPGFGDVSGGAGGIKLGGDRSKAGDIRNGPITAGTGFTFAPGSSGNSNIALIVLAGLAALYLYKKGFK